MYAKWPSASICVPCCPGSALACMTSLLNACAENGTPEVLLYCVPAGLANGDLGIVLLRTNDASYTCERGCAMCQAQRCSVIGPSVLAMPRSSPAPHGGAGLRLAVWIRTAGSAASTDHDAPNDSMAARQRTLARRELDDRFISGLQFCGGPHVTRRRLARASWRDRARCCAPSKPASRQPCEGRRRRAPRPAARYFSAASR